MPWDRRVSPVRRKTHQRRPTGHLSAASLAGALVNGGQGRIGGLCQGGALACRGVGSATAVGVRWQAVSGKAKATAMQKWSRCAMQSESAWPRPARCAAHPHGAGWRRCRLRWRSRGFELGAHPLMEKSVPQRVCTSPRRQSQPSRSEKLATCW